MKLRKESIIIALTVFISLSLGVKLGFCQIVIPCNALPTGYTDEQFGQIIVTSAITSTSVGGIPVLPYCDVRGIIQPDIRFNIKVPVADWNQRLYMTGWRRDDTGISMGRGDDGGMINEAGMVTALSRGFATAGSDGGHQLTFEPFSWAYNPLPENTNPDAVQKKYDFYFRANHETAVLAKNIIGAYWGSGTPLLYSYFEGASDGGRQALVEAQLYPQDFDGIIAASPVMNCAWGNVRYIWNKQATLAADISSNELQNVAEAVYEKCDSVDGLVDGFIDDPRKCNFDPEEDLSGFTPSQIETMNRIYEGPRTTDGIRIYYGTPFGAEITDAQGMRGWQQYGPILPMPVFGEVSINNAIGFLKYMAFEPAVDPLTYDYTDFNLDTNLGNMANTAAWCSAEDPNLLPFKSAGGKLIQWHGYADAVNPPLASIDYYEGVLGSMGEEATKSFYKLYMIPGAFNGGGIGCSDIDWLSVIQQWVENEGFEPSAIIGTRAFGGGYSFRTRPACAYPQVARYLGTGSIDDALNFSCVHIVPSSVSIKPNRINPGSRGTFKTTMTLPAGYDVRNFTQIAVTCEGAPGQKIKIGKKGTVVKARFNKDDLLNITPGKAVTFTVTAIYEEGGHLLAFEGSESIHVID